MVNKNHNLVMNSSSKIVTIISVGLIMEASLIYTGMLLGTVSFGYDTAVIVLLLLGGIAFGFYSYQLSHVNVIDKNDLIKKLIDEINSNISILLSLDEMYPLLHTETYIFVKNSGLPSNNTLDIAYNTIYAWNHKGERARLQSPASLKILSLAERKERKELLNLLNRTLQLFDNVEK